LKLTDGLRGEHGAFYALFDEVEAMGSSAGNAAQAQSAMAVLAALVTSHGALEEKLLYSALEPHLGKGAPLDVMREEHAEIERTLERLEDAYDVDQAIGWVMHALSIARSHFLKEEQVLFTMAEQILDDEALTRLGQAWADARNVAIP
jgi:iron-sulfur cluster repair protein YtfE (RIC family)